MDEKKQPWDKLEGETDKAYDTFLLFAALPLHRRSVSEVYRLHPPKPEKQKKAKKGQKKPTNPPSAWYGWRNNNNWIERARARDQYYAELERLELLEDRKALLREQRKRLLKRRDESDKLLKICTDAFSQKGVIEELLAVFPSTAASIYKTTTAIRESTERELLGLNTVQLQEAPHLPTKEEQAELAELVAMLEQQAKEGNTQASKMLFSLNGVKL